MCFSHSGNLISIDDLAIEESSKKRDPEKGALFSLFKTIGTRFDIHPRSSHVPMRRNLAKKLSITCSKINKFLEMSE